MEIRINVALIVLMLSQGYFTQTTSTLASPDWTDDADWTGTAPGVDINQDTRLSHNSTLPPNSLRVEDGFTLTIDADVTLTISRNLIVGSGGTLIVNGTIDGTNPTRRIRVRSGGSVTISPTGSLQWAGRYSGNATAGPLQIDGDMRVDGRFNNSADVTGSGDLNVGTLLANNGTVFGCTLPDDECCAEPYCSTTGGGPLPIELLYFRSELALQAVNLQWRTAAEIGNDYFTIERSKDGSNFETLGTIDGAGNSTWQIDYSFSDSKPLSGTSYYRLKQTDYDGQYEYSEVIASNYGLATQYQNFKIYPNPTTSREFNVLFDFKASSVGITLFDIAGIAIKEYTYSNIEVNSRERIVLDSEVPSGVYVLQVHSGDMVQHKKLIVKN